MKYLILISALLLISCSKHSGDNPDIHYNQPSIPITKNSIDPTQNKEVTPSITSSNSTNLPLVFGIQIARQYCLDNPSQCIINDENIILHIENYYLNINDTHSSYYYFVHDGFIHNTETKTSTDLNGKTIGFFDQNDPAATIVLLTPSNDNIDQSQPANQIALQDSIRSQNHNSLIITQRIKNSERTLIKKVLP